MARPRTGAIGALLAAGLVIAGAAAAEPELPLAILQENQGLSAVTTDVAVSPDGRHVYASGADFLVVLRRLPDGKLAFVEEHLLGREGVRVVVPPDGRGVLALASEAGEAGVVSFRRNEADGTLTWVEVEVAELGGSVSDLATSRDGQRVYVTSPGYDALVVYARDAETGALAFAQRIENTDPGVSGLGIPRLLAVSPDDRHVYVSGRRQAQDEPPVFLDTIVLLRREPDGSLSFVESLDVDAFLSDLAADMDLTPDGAELLVLDGGAFPGAGAALRRYTRDPGDGRLSFLASRPIEEPGFFAGTLAWFAQRPDGRRVFFAGISSGPPGLPVMAWSRDEAGGMAPIARVETGRIIASGVSSPDGRYLYTSTALGVRVLVPEPGAAPGALAALAALGLRRRASRRRPPRARASARA